MSAAVGRHFHTVLSMDPESYPAAMRVEMDTTLTLDQLRAILRDAERVLDGRVTRPAREKEQE